VILFIGVCALPAAYMFGVSFVSSDGTFTFSNYARLLSEPRQRELLRTTIVLGIGASAIASVIGVPVGVMGSDQVNLNLTPRVLIAIASYAMKLRLTVLIICLLQPFAAGQTVTSPTSAFEDHDRDGLDDHFEQQLLERFLPTFLISVDDCDGSPAEFLADSSTPVVFARNGTVYGQVSRYTGDGNKAFLEIHYYHLWGRDCGRLGHQLDPEHVSALVRAEGIEQPPSAWKAVYWYAAAHEGTLCDGSNGARAGLLEAEERGAKVWISEGKHASFLSESKCRFGCGDNRCEQVKVMETRKLINIGEIGLPMNGVVWAQSDRWILKAKMRTDFTPAVLARLDAPGNNGIITVNAPPPPTQALLLGGNSSFGAFLLGNQSAGKALSIGGAESIHAVGKALSLSGKSLLLVERKLLRLVPRE